MKICKCCVLPETFPNIKFDDDGVCNHCAKAKYAPERNDEKERCLEKFEELISSVKGKGDYDCALAYSGGKDSTYTLYLLRKRFGLRVLALTLDNGFVSGQAFNNIRASCEALGVDSLIVKPDFGLLRLIFRASIESPLYSAKTLERASTICTSCIGLAKFTFLKTVIEKRVPLMAWGWTPGQAPLRSAVMKTNAQLFRSMQAALKKPMEQAAGESLGRFFLSEADFARADAFPYNVSPLAFLEYDEAKIFSTIAALGWKSPEGVDGNSTNCLLNSFANRQHIEKYGYHPYAFEIAGMVRSGDMERGEGLSKLGRDGGQEALDFVKLKLEL